MICGSWSRYKVSIHAPAWGATGFSVLSCPDCWSFNPRSRMGSDLYTISQHQPYRCFNPRSRMGSDFPNVPATCLLVQFQSTLPHGERRERWRARPVVDDRFNPRSRMGSDVCPPPQEHRQCSFNPRSRMGSDPNRPGFSSSPGCFNPRSRMGSDCRPRRPRSSARVSIHAPAWGATRSKSWLYSVFKVSIHAPAWGATRGSRTSRPDRTFQSTLPHGERPRPWD